MPVLESIRLSRFLSFGPGSEPIGLTPLNVLIGPNASGKSNLIEAISILQSLPSDIHVPINQGGGLDEWLWKGIGDKGGADIDVAFNDLTLAGRYSLTLWRLYGRFNIVEQFRDFAGIVPEDFIGRDDTQSILAQRRGPKYESLSRLASYFERIRIYRNWTFGVYSPSRLSQAAELPDDFLLDNGANLAMVLQALRVEQPDSFQRIVREIRAIHSAIVAIEPRAIANRMTIFFREKGLDGIVPSTRMSDGTLRYLCLLTILCHPDPPPLICIEEPEIGLHPDILPDVARLLVEASSRTQLIITTHSDVLVSALTDEPESVLVFGRDASGTHVQRVELGKVQSLLEDHTLGELWRMGEIGGNRW